MDTEDGTGIICLDTVKEQPRIDSKKKTKQNKKEWATEEEKHVEL